MCVRQSRLPAFVWCAPNVPTRPGRKIRGKAVPMACLAEPAKLCTPENLHTQTNTRIQQSRLSALVWCAQTSQLVLDAECGAPQSLVCLAGHSTNRVNPWACGAFIGQSAHPRTSALDRPAFQLSFGVTQTSQRVLDAECGATQCVACLAGHCTTGRIRRHSTQSGATPRTYGHLHPTDLPPSSHLVCPRPPNSSYIPCPKHSLSDTNTQTPSPTAPSMAGWRPQSIRIRQSRRPAFVWCVPHLSTPPGRKVMGPAVPGCLAGIA